MAALHKPAVGLPPVEFAGCHAGLPRLRCGDDAMSYVSSNCVMPKPQHICIGFDNDGLDLVGNVGVRFVLIGSENVGWPSP